MQSIKLPPHFAALPTSHLALPPPLITPYRHTQTANTRPASSLRSIRGGSDELPEKSYGGFGLTGDSRAPGPSVFMFFLFCPCVDFSKFTRAQSLRAVSNFPSTSSDSVFRPRPSDCTFVCFCYIGVSAACSHLNANQIVELLQMLILLIDRPV